MALTREERNARKAARNHAKLMAMTPEEHTEYNVVMLARRRKNELLPLYVEFGFVTADLRGEEYIPPDIEPVEPPQGWSDEWEQVTTVLRGKIASGKIRIRGRK